MTFLFNFSPFYKYKISGNSMFPTLHDGQVIVINRVSYVLKKPQIGEIIACKDPRDKKILIKRITKVISEEYFVQGDNKKHSTDSRVFGMIRRSDILGKVITP